MQCFINVATSPKHPCWCLLGNVLPSVAPQTVSQPVRVQVSPHTEPRALELLRRCQASRLAVQVQLRDSPVPARTRWLFANLAFLADQPAIVELSSSSSVAADSAAAISQQV